MNAARMVVGSLALLSLTGQAIAQVEEQPRQDLMDEVRRLRERVEQLERQAADGQAHAERQAAAEKQAADRTIKEVLADAEQRSTPLQLDGFTAGYSGDRFVLQSADGNFVFSPGVLLQLRHVTSYRESTPDGGDSTDAGFEVRRLWLLLSGNLFTPQLTYHFQFGTGVNGGNVVMDQAWVQYAFPETPFALRVGAYTNTWDHETAVHIGRQLAVDRSILNQIITTGATGTENYVQGIELQYQSVDEWRASVMYHDGMLTRNTNFQNEAATAPAIGIVNPGGGAAGRFEYKVAGNWTDYSDFTALNTRKDLLVLGGGFNFDTADNLNAIMYTIDVQWEPADVHGLGVYGAVVGMHREFRNLPAGGNGSANDWGLTVQAGYLLAPRWEVFGRYTYMKLDDHAPAGPGTLGAAARITDVIHEVTGGVNYYLRDHAAKFTVDAVFLPDGSGVNLPGIGILRQPSADPQLALRMQFQLRI